ncbi:hypothetical protein BD626DRAFT_624997 [Schizophyllum amplum]|uniref:Uncharacterized protein n=1 Tax=Schizophyllum amplum TaxID=97359 RepID=A0A550CXZ3_9AGAR|nr:hypothetical protein BD626DRAFT_624997 [Auriculariopsis ampla]
MSLLESIDRLSQQTKAIRTSAGSIAPRQSHLDPRLNVSGPFTRAILYTQLGDLIREVEPTELGLFHVVESPASKEVPATSAAEFTRVSVPVATPLRKPAHKDERRQRSDPEVYAKAALRYIEDFGHIRPAPRARAQAAAIIEQAEEARRNIQELHEALQQAHAAEPASLASEIEAEEALIHELQARISTLKNRKESAIQRKKLAATPVQKPPALGRTPVRARDEDENSFWNTPSAPQQSSFGEEMSDQLLDESLGDISEPSFAMSPVKSARQPLGQRSRQDERVQPQPKRGVHSEDEPIKPASAEGYQSQSPTEIVGAAVAPEDASASQDEDTIIISRPSPPPTPPPKPSTPPPNPAMAPQTPGTAKRLKVRVNAEVERIVAKIWQTVGDIIMPNHTYQVGPASSGKAKPPNARETIAHLRDISALSTTGPMSPSASSVSTLATTPIGAATPQQIFTAYLLLELLACAPSFTLPLNRAKELLADKAREDGGSALGQQSNSIVYKCVAKRLVKIIRSGREQVVAFDV